MRKLLVLILVVTIFIPSFNTSALSTSAKAAILINADTGEVIYEHNADER